jgi:hypothetical protein
LSPEDILPSLEDEELPDAVSGVASFAPPPQAVSATVRTINRSAILLKTLSFIVVLLLPMGLGTEI